MDKQSFINNDSDSIPPSVAAKIGSNIGSMLIQIMWDSIIDEAKEEFN